MVSPEFPFPEFPFPEFPHGEQNMNIRLFFPTRWAAALCLAVGGLVWATEAGICAQLRGTVTIVNESYIKRSLPDMSKHCKYSGDPGTFKMLDTLTIELCMQDGEMTVAQGRRTFQVSGKESSRYECDTAECTQWKDGHVVVLKKKPGHQWQVKEHFVFRFYRGKEWSPSMQVSGVGFMPVFSEDLKPEELMKVYSSPVPVKGRYQIMVSAEDYVGKEGYVETRHIDPCAQTASAFTFRTEMTDPSKEPSNWVDSMKNPQVAIATLPAGPWPIAATWEIDFDPKGCGGTKVIEQDENHTLTAQWNFRLTTPCDQAKEAIDHDLAYAEGYMDKETRKQDPDKYKCYVDRWVFEKMYGRPPDPGTLDCEKKPDPTKGEVQGVGDELGVNSDCELVGEKEYRDQAAGKCLPDGVVNGVMAHEMVHVKQCKEQHERYNSNDTGIWGDMEAEAHLAGVQYMLDWMRGNCPESDVKPFEKRMDAIRKQLPKR
jgi:hypothetical protein